MGNYLITMPDVGEGIAEVEIITWHVAIGDRIEEDDPLCEVMTDKAVVEIPSPVDGEVTWIGSETGVVMAVGADLIRLQVEGEGNLSPDDVSTEAASSVDEVKPDVNSSQKQKVTESASQSMSQQESAADLLVESPATQQASQPPWAEGEKPIASPAVRQRARNAGIDLRYVHGTGPAGRITHEDIDQFMSGSLAGGRRVSSGAQAETSVKEIKVQGLRKRIAEVMQDTMQRIPHFTYVEEIDVTELEALRKKLNANRDDAQPKLTMLPFFIKAIVRALKVYPQMGSRYDDEGEIVYQYGGAHIGIAAQTPRGLVVPVVKHAETLDIWGAASEIKRLADLARSGKASREELSGSTITLSSLGPKGGIATTPVINAPEVAIIGVNKVVKRPVWQEGGFVPRDMMNLSSSFDHRIIDGWDATQFIHYIKDLLESPASLFMEG